MQSTRLGKFTVWFENSEEFHSVKREVFSQHIYQFESNRPDPVIVDVGAQIGLSVLYFKQLYPHASILAIEPNPTNVTLLRKNVAENILEGVQIVPVAVGGENGTRTLYVDAEGEWYSTSSFLPRAWNNTQETVPIEVETRRLSELLPPKTDVLKLDVEGVEEEVLVELGGKLQTVEMVLFEFHPAYGRTPERIERLLKAQGFSVGFWQKGKQVDWRKTRGLLLGEARRVGNF